MPWIKDEHGNDKYLVSDYTISELPTWAEIYDEFYKNELYNIEKYVAFPDTQDLYWKIPHKKFLMIVVCNQLNKMLKEDEYESKLIELIKDECGIDSYEHVSFSLLPTNDYDIVTEPPIYTVVHPTGKKDIFITNMRTRINSDELPNKLTLSINLAYTNNVGGKEVLRLAMDEAMSHEWEYSLYMMIMEYMMKNIVNYFEGESIGWKDDNGHIIESESDPRGCVGAGYDPAL